MEEKTPKEKIDKKSSNTEIQKEFSAGGVVYKKSQVSNLKSQILWLVTKSSPSKLYPQAYWRLPKGWLDDKDAGKKPGPLASGERKATEKELQNSALREVKEESGVEAKLIKKLGTETVFFTKANVKVFKFVTFYLMEWQRDSLEGPGYETSEVAWLPFKEARRRLKYPAEKKILDKAKTLLDSGFQESLV